MEIQGFVSILKLQFKKKVYLSTATVKGNISIGRILKIYLPFPTSPFISIGSNSKVSENFATR